MRLRSCTLLLFKASSCLLKSNSSKLHHSSLISMTRTFSNWHIVGAVCLERKPILTQQLNPLEEKYFQYLQKLEVEKSLLSEHEKRHLDDKKIAEKLKKGELEDMDSISKQTAQDFEDACLEKYNSYQPNQRITEADMKNDQQSLQRKLDSSLVFTIRQKLGNDLRWILPQAVHQDGETLRQTAERSLQLLCPTLPKVQFMGNAPVAYYKYKYPKLARENGFCGAKVFFFKAQLLDKTLKYLDINLTESTSGSLWLTHLELNDFLQTDYCKAVHSFLFPDVCQIDQEEKSQHSSSEEDEPIRKKSAAN